MTRLDRAATALGAVSWASLAVAQLSDRYAVLPLESWSVAVAVVLGLAAVAAGLTRRRWAASATGVAFVVAAIVQVAVWTAGDSWLGGNGSTASVWLGLGVGLIAVGSADRLWPVATPDGTPGATPGATPDGIPDGTTAKERT
jgi:peptidoglycan/LPS O-acetylase OafA/YrhL